MYRSLKRMRRKRSARDGTPSQKKWFVPADKDITLFARWQAESGAVESARSKTSPAKIGSSSRKTAAGVKTHATVEDFVAYNGDAPPWD